jgi:uncharacterized membrane protein YccF (DUF307 family)
MVITFWVILLFPATRNVLVITIISTEPYHISIIRCDETQRKKKTSLSEIQYEPNDMMKVSGVQ